MKEMTKDLLIFLEKKKEFVRCGYFIGTGINFIESPQKNAETQPSRSHPS